MQGPSGGIVRLPPPGSLAIVRSRDPDETAAMLRPRFGKVRQLQPVSSAFDVDWQVLPFGR